jgi:hypothetical protein
MKNIRANIKKATISIPEPIKKDIEAGVGAEKVVDKMSADKIPADKILGMPKNAFWVTVGVLGIAVSFLIYKKIKK